MEQRTQGAASGPGAATVDDHLADIRAQLAVVVRSYTERPLVSRWRAEPELVRKHLDQLLPSLVPVLKLVDQCAGAKFKPGSRFEPPRLKAVQRKASSIHSLVHQLVDLRVRFVELTRTLESVLPLPEAVLVANVEAKTLFAYHLRKVGVPPRVIADAIGDLERMPTHLRGRDLVEEREVRIRALRLRLRRFEKELRTGWTTCDRENVSL